MNLIFMGTPEFALPTLAALPAAGHRVACVYSQPPRPAKRGQKERPSPVHAFAVDNGLTVRTPASLKDEGEQRAFKALAADAAVVVAYGLILPPPVVAAPRLGCLNVHASLLPRWRGAAPIQHAILEGDEETGVTIMRIDDGLDTGPIIIAEKVPIAPDATAAMLHDQLAELGAQLMVRALDGLAAGTLKLRPQPATGVTVAPKLGRDDGRLDWRRPAAALERQVRAFAPWPGAWFKHAGHRIKVLAAAVEAGGGEAVAPAGTTVDDALGVACGAGVLRLTEVQRAGRAAQPAGAFLRGYPMPKGARLA